ncbi:protein MpLTL2 [Marchantia polymorpha subsp. ruderalis]
MSVVMTAKWMGAAGVATQRKPPPAMFVFGDSLVDYGNNNYLKSLTKANYKPYGIDFPGHIATGRYCNGRLVPDFISEFMGAESVSPYLYPNATLQDWERGVNFASAGAGILLDTGYLFNERLVFQKQLSAFLTVRQNLTSGRLGVNGTNDLVSKALFLINVGSNDYINNYMLPPSLSPRIKKYGLVEYQNLLIGTFRHDLQALHDAGARKIVVSNLGPIGCIPQQLALWSRNGSCVTHTNRIAFSYNAGLKNMLQGLRKQLPDAHFLYMDVYHVVMDHIKSPGLGGFKHRSSACCGAGPFNGLIICNPFGNLCSNRSEYIFWDAFHPTEAFNSQLAHRVMYGPKEDVSPINIQQLLDL